MRREHSDLASFIQLVQDLINGSVRRHTFTQSELELLLDLQTCRLRKSSKPEALRRYARVIQQNAGQDGKMPRFSAFLEGESATRLAASLHVTRLRLPQTAA